MNEFMATAVKPETSSFSAPQLLRQPYRLAAIGLLAFLFVVNIYRAATQSISHDEAVTWEWLPYAKSITQFFDSEIANHHPLNNYLGKLMADIFGLSEFS